jgi:hypothetical protein
VDGEIGREGERARGFEEFCSGLEIYNLNGVKLVNSI